MKLSECQIATGGRLLGGDCAFVRLSTDTRTIRHGDLFVALRGERFDAHEFLATAAEKGACGLVVDQPAGPLHLPQLVVEDTTRALGAIAALNRDQFGGKVIGITGSSGKTTVKGLLMAVVSGVGKARATRGNLNNQIGVPLTLMTIEPDDDFAVVEIGTNSPGEIGYLTELAKPNVALVNNVMAAHLGGFGSLAGIAREKSQIYSQLRADECAVINLDDAFAQYFLDATRNVRQLGFCMSRPPASLRETCEFVYAEAIEEDALGRPRFQIVSGETREPVQLAVLGMHNVRNALAAAACAIAAGIDLPDVARGLAHFTGEAGRMQIGKAAGGATLVDDSYNANPGSVRAAIDFLAARPQPRVLVLGDLAELGADAEQEHRALGEYAREAGIDMLFTCGELTQETAAAFGASASHFSGQQELIAAVKCALSPETVVLVKGSRSSRMEKVIAALSQTGESE